MLKFSRSAEEARFFFFFTKDSRDSFFSVIWGCLKRQSFPQWLVTKEIVNCSIVNVWNLSSISKCLETFLKTFWKFSNNFQNVFKQIFKYFSKECSKTFSKQIQREVQRHLQKTCQINFQKTFKTFWIVFKQSPKLQTC